MKPKKTWGILAFVILAIVGLGLWDHKKTERESETSKDSKVFNFKSQEISGIEVTNPNSSEFAPKISLSKESSGWLITYPERFTADSAAVDMMLNLLSDLTYSKVAGSGVDRFEVFGVIDALARKIRLTKSNGEMIDIWIGAKAPLGFSVYIRQSARPDEILVANQHVLSATGKNLDDFRDKTVFHFEKDQVTSINFGGIRLSKAEQKWTLISSEGSFLADEASVATWLSDLNSVKASDISTKNPKDEKLNDLVISSSDGKNFFKGKAGVSGEKVKIWNAEAGLYFELDSNVKSFFTKKTEDFRQKKLLDFPSAEISKITINGEGFQKEGQAWKPNDKQPLIDIAGFILDLDFARATGFAASAKISAKKPKWSIALETAKGDKRLYRIFENETGTDYLVGLDLAPDLMVIAKAGFEKIDQVK